MGMNSGLAPRSSNSGSAGRRTVIRATSPAASANGWRSASVAVAEPDLLVLDEPTRGLDPDRKAVLAAWLQEYAASGKGVLLATHDRDLPAHRRIGLSVDSTQTPLLGSGVGV